MRHIDRIETLIPALQAALDEAPQPEHVTLLEASGIERVNLIDATPIGINVRSTVATNPANITGRYLREML